MQTSFDVIVVGGGPCGTIAAEQLIKSGYSVALIDPDNRIKPCGGAIPNRAIKDFAIPEHMLVAKANAARVIAPSGNAVEMRIGDIGFVGMVDRETFDPYLRRRAASAGAAAIKGKLAHMEEASDGTLDLTIEPTANDCPKTPYQLKAKMVIGADGANSAVRRAMFPSSKKPPYVFAYHEIVESPADADADRFQADRCDVVYDGRISPDFYGWVFPHGNQTSVGCGSAVKGHSLRQATQDLREQAGLSGQTTIRREGAPLPLRPMRRWDNGKNVVLAGDAAGTVAPSSGEGIYYAMLCGVLAADAVAASLATGKAAALKNARRRFMKDHGRIFLILRIMQGVWYRNDRLRERFVTMCADPDVQRLTWESYLNKKLVRRDPLAHVRVFFKDLGQLAGLPAGHK
ncbi:geranylgeranyl diphosphate reductase [Roseibium denhamense]|uniref:Geranylgeranyl reductase n=1 Tax=Roseibium denhamense TaxID=76305 RepID=A0ABY1PN28_9HYPH|nr:geranylgeranyl diphosphate reductase [Roseibium denhamense]MTI03994.1 geranylgeranyl diphosphate reductase [Roseibium denhamense]SMP36140.1 geranylgeranyl reductase [Roseibium denhamense]